MRTSALLLVGLLGLAACTASADNAASGASASTDNDLKSSGKVLLDCNVFLSGGGPDQQVTIVQKGDALTMKELTRQGAMIERPLSQEEWESKDLELTANPEDYGVYVNRLYLEKGDWMYESKDDSWHAMGIADCAR